MSKFYRIHEIEKLLISKKNRFTLDLEQKKEIFNKFSNKNHLVIGAAGSIGSVFSQAILSFKPKKLFLLDKDENELTELNREINAIKKTNSIQYICCDALNFDFKNFCNINKITGIFNFSALKHVRSEENLISANYMLKVNSAYFLNHRYSQNVKYIFSVSTDKTNIPTSLLGISKKLMEHTLFELKKKNQKKDICTVRFTNVSFSKGSILKSIYDRCMKGGKFGIPLNVERHFITHEEAASLCLKSILDESKNYIILPNYKKINKQKKKILEICIKILKLFKIKYELTSSGIKAKGLTIKYNKVLTYGQKKVEDLFTKNEKYYALKDSMILKTKFTKLANYEKIIKIINNKKKNNLNLISKKIFQKFSNENNKKVKLSENI